jgi:16S rRNA G966 N2-methylase RsmD
VQAISRNLENTGLSDLATIVRGDARRVADRVAHQYGPFRVIFIDPPYDDPGGSQVAVGLLRAAALDPEGTLVLQHSRRSEAPGLPSPDFTRRFGETELLFFSALAEET